MEYPILLADSSDDTLAKENQLIIRKFPNLNIIYQKFPNSIHPMEKISKAADYLETPYVVYIADDDYLNIEVIPKMITFLEENDDFSLVHGKYFGFEYNHDKIETRKIYQIISREEEEGINRISQNFSNYKLLLLHAIQRTDEFKQIWEITALNSNNFRFGELLSSAISLSFGKSRCMDIPYEIREINTSSLGHKKKGINGFIADGSYDAQFYKFKEAILNHLENQSTKLPRSELESQFLIGWNQYLQDLKPSKNNISLSKKILLRFPFVNRIKLLLYHIMNRNHNDYNEEESIFIQKFLYFFD